MFSQNATCRTRSRRRKSQKKTTKQTKHQDLNSISIEIQPNASLSVLDQETSNNIHNPNIIGRTSKCGMQRHHGTKHLNQHRFNCSFCQQTFGRKSDMKRHSLEIHEGKMKEYECSSCHKQFGRKSDRKRHFKATHTSSKPHFICSKCTKQYTRQSSLNRHLKKCLAAGT